MGYFSNGSEGLDFEAHFCCRCVYAKTPKGCPIWDAHLVFNYDECNNEKSILHWFIKRGTKETQWEQECKYFAPLEQSEQQGGSDD